MSKKDVQKLQQMMQGKKKKPPVKTARTAALEGRKHFSSGGGTADSMIKQAQADYNGSSFNHSSLGGVTVSNKSYDLMKSQQYLLTNDIEYKKINNEFSEKLKKLYISNFCWTWNDRYLWPKIEIFFKINSNVRIKNIKKISNTSLPIIFLGGDYKISFVRSYLTRIISFKYRKKIKKFLNKYLRIAN